MAIDKLLKTLPLLQGQIDALLEFQVNFAMSILLNGIKVYFLVYFAGYSTRFDERRYKLQFPFNVSRFN